MNNIIVRNGFIMNPTIEVTPSIRISPFTENDLGMADFDTKSATEYLKNRFNNYCLTIKARDAIFLALSYYELKKDDVVTILTTSGNYYISSCVTKEIEKFCLWSRELSNKTKLIFVNHEFGYPLENLEEVKGYGLPIIEDYAHTFVSENEKRQTSKIGDFIIYSLPKYFPMQIGGILVAEQSKLNSLHYTISTDNCDYILGHLSLSIPSLEEISKKRLFNYAYLKNKLQHLGIVPFFPEKKNIVPGVFLFRWNDNINYDLLKEFMQANGVESSVFYGENAFFIPIHHKLEVAHLDYMISLLNYFKEKYITNT